MPVIPAKFGVLTWKSPDGKRRGYFRSNRRSAPNTVTLKPGYRPNPEDFDSPAEGSSSAQLLVGFNVGGEPTYEINELIAIVQEVRLRQGKPPDSSFVAQKGIYTSSQNGQMVTEDGAQIIVFNLWGDSYSEFRKQMVELGEVVAKVMHQELVILKLFEDGKEDRTIGVTAKKK